MTNPNEAAFEAEICAWLTQSGGYDEVKDDKAQGADSDFDRATGLDRIELLRFISATQMPEWEELVKRNGGDPDKTQLKFRERVAAEIDKRGVVDVLRHGVIDQGVRFRLAYFKPAHGLSKDLTAKYAGEPADRDPAAALPGGLEQVPRPGAAAQRHPGRDRGAEEPAHRAGCRAGDDAVPHRPGPEEPGAASGRWCTSRSTRSGSR